MKALAEFCYRKRWLVLASWIVFLIGITVFSQAVSGEFRTEFKLPGSETQNALDLLKAQGDGNRTGFPGQIVFRAENGVNDPQVKQAMERFFADMLAAIPNSDIESPYDPGSS